MPIFNIFNRKKLPTEEILMNILSNKENVINNQTPQLPSGSAPRSSIALSGISTKTVTDVDKKMHDLITNLVSSIDAEIPTGAEKIIDQEALRSVVLAGHLQNLDLNSELNIQNIQKVLSSESDAKFSTADSRLDEIISDARKVINWPLRKINNILKNAPGSGSLDESSKNLVDLIDKIKKNLKDCESSADFIEKSKYSTDLSNNISLLMTTLTYIIKETSILDKKSEDYMKKQNDIADKIVKNVEQEKDKFAYPKDTGYLQREKDYLLNKYAELVERHNGLTSPKEKIDNITNMLSIIRLSKKSAAGDELKNISTQDLINERHGYRKINITDTEESKRVIENAQEWLDAITPLVDKMSNRILTIHEVLRSMNVNVDTSPSNKGHRLNP